MEAAVRKRFERIEAILDGVAKNHAAAIARMDRADARMDRSDTDWKTRMDRADARMDRSDTDWKTRMDRSEADWKTRMDRSEADWKARMDRADRRMKGFEQLVRIGMKELANQRKEQMSRHKDTEAKINALIESHQRTEAVLRRFMSSFPKGGNGHSRNQN